MKITVFVTPKESVLDPQGAAVQQAMASIGCHGNNVRMGKMITFEYAGETGPELREQLHTMCKQLFCNPLIEDYRLVIEDQRQKEVA